MDAALNSGPLTGPSRCSRTTLSLGQRAFEIDGPDGGEYAVSVSDGLATVWRQCRNDVTGYPGWESVGDALWNGYALVECDDELTDAVIAGAEDTIAEVLS